MPGTVELLDQNVCGAFRTAMASVVKATTGAQVTISATVDGYSRSAGSFLTDGFDIGDEVSAAGFAGASIANNGLGWITWLSDTVMQVTRPAGVVQVAAAAGGSVTITAGMPRLHVLENWRTDDVLDQPWTRETYQPAGIVPASLRSPTALVRHTGVWWLHIFYPANTGTSGVKRLRGKIMASIYPAMDLRYAGQVIRVQAASKKNHTQDAQWAGAPIAFHWQADTLNPG